MKRWTALVPIWLLATSINVQANAYCDSRRSVQEVETCYRQSLTALKRAVDKGLSKIMSSRNYSEVSKQRIFEEQHAWEQSVQTNCQDYACVEYQFQGRLLQLGRMKADPAPSAMDTEACLDDWIAAYRQEEGDEVAIIHDQITEWQQWCSEGRLP
ncbi:TPA: hypothetical protein ACHSDM_004718 [Pseudomonas aeruginosa]|uniref:hypothetical protein n=1 Tax=Pseudomonas aeruginosa TaxID=287 RepID=UPI00071B1F6E|nr:hypothetical protein [Pseudomonas aeruginosa]ALU49750.1 hypothetical protein AU380_18830 [Pseudomonas aeruginosa]KSD33293.1 hypothetical protein AO900_23465 [Pseudomonas aeruginosa]MBI8355407.1 hypothetical protein [Pseudomonas aeruginosa]MEC6381626.1 hypothetical protein [Pseudomonas aeruginosa]MWW49201.1 hypothetical protein [Pseudomonas aeruginosa]